MNYDQETIENAKWISLSEGEEVRAWSHASIYPYIPVYIMSILMILAGLIAPFVFETSTMVTYLFLALIPTGLIILILEHVRYVSVFYVFTDDRVFRKLGILRHRTRSVGYDAVDKVKTDQTLIGRILKYGDMIVVTATPTDEDIKLTYLPDLQEGNNIVSDYTGYKASRRDKETIKNKEYRKKDKDK